MSRTRLLITLWLPVALCALLAAAYELELLLPGLMAGNAALQVCLVGFMELATICLIPVALRLYRFRAVASDLRRRGSAALNQWGMVRIGMLTLPMLINTMTYYLTLNVAPGYLAIIGLLVLPFIYPSKARCKAEEDEFLHQ